MKIPGATPEDERLVHSVIDKYAGLWSVLNRSEAVEGAVIDMYLIFTDDKFRQAWSVGLMATGTGGPPNDDSDD